MSASAQNSTNALAALAPAYGEQPPAFWEQHESTIIVAGIAVLVFACFFLKVMLRPASPKILPPEVVARQSLVGLENQPEDRNTLAAVSYTLRRYVSQAFNLPGSELTTTELCSVIESDQQMGEELARTISSFLRECDVRKFSRAKPTTPLKAAARALVLITRVENRVMERRGMTMPPR